MTSYSSAQKRYLSFCETYNLPPLPLSESVTCLLAAFLAHQGLKSQSVSVYLSALRHLQITAGLPAPQRAEWPRLKYVLKGIARVQPLPSARRLPITAAIMLRLQAVCSTVTADVVEAHMLWAACCLGYFGFMRSGEFTLQNASSPPSVRVSDIAVDSHDSPSLVSLFLRRAKTDPFGKGISIFLGKSGSTLCPVLAVLSYLAVRPNSEGPLLVRSDGSPLTRDQFVRLVKRALSVANIDSSAYSGHSFRIGAASAAAAAGVPAYVIKALGRWESEAYHVYIRTPREALASVAQVISQVQ